MHVGLYFGSFNPIHIGHLIIANHVLNATDVEKVWFVVSPQNPLKPSATLLNEYDRLHLVNLAIEGNSHFMASSIEFKLPKPSYTVDTMAYLMEKYPQHHFSIIMGGDSYQNLPRWKNNEVLKARYRFIVYKRPGFDIAPGENNTVVLEAPLLDISATTIRKLILEKKSIMYLVPDSVRGEIEANRYYLPKV